VDPRYVFLVRHASRDRDPRQPERNHGIKDKKPRRNVNEGRVSRTESIAGALADQFDLPYLAQSVIRMRHSPHKAAKETAEVFAEVLATRRVAVGVTPQAAEYLAPNAPADEARRQLDAVDASALVVVGHQPQLTQLARQWLNRRLPSGTLPLAASEVACLRLGNDPRLLWMLTEKPRGLKKEFLDKIKSKLDVAKFFLGALVVNASVLLSSMLASVWTPSMRPAGAVLMGLGSTALFMALGLTVATLLAFDRLAMPSEFWSEEPRRPGRKEGIRRSEPSPPLWGIARPPSEAVTVLFYETIHVWTRLFEPALVSAITAIVCFFLAVIAEKTEMAARTLAVVVLAVLALGIAVIALYARHKPKLGFED
jgi:phosphohistidine phosphatase SixA